MRLNKYFIVELRETYIKIEINKNKLENIMDEIDKETKNYIELLTKFSKEKQEEKVINFRLQFLC